VQHVCAPDKGGKERKKGEKKEKKGKKKEQESPTKHASHSTCPTMSTTESTTTPSMEEAECILAKANGCCKRKSTNAAAVEESYCKMVKHKPAANKPVEMEKDGEKTKEDSEDEEEKGRGEEKGSGDDSAKISNEDT
jgi:hypothetical protein